MDIEDKQIAERFGRRTPFKVPEGYFDNFASQLMQSLPEDNKIVANETVESVAAPVASQLSATVAPAQTAKHISLWPRRVTVAAASVACLVGIGGYLGLRSGQDHPAMSQHVAAQTETTVGVQSNYSEIDAMADYAMLDNEDLYAAMADASVY